MKYILFITFSCVFFSCSDSFINHDLKYEKAGDCTDAPKSVKMTSNINGERYEFACCLDEYFNGKNYTVERKGDSIVVGFPKTQTKKQVMFDLILDIDAKPAYHHIILGDKELSIVPSQR